MISAGPPASPTRTAAGRAVPARAGTTPAVTMPATRLRRVRWGVRAALFVGVAASVAANILHAAPTRSASHRGVAAAGAAADR